MTQALIGKNIQETVLNGIIVIDTTNGRVGINQNNPAYPLDVTGDIRTTTLFRVGSASVLTETTLGSAVVNSSLTSLGTLSGLTISSTSSTVSSVISTGTSGEDSRILIQTSGASGGDPLIAFDISSVVGYAMGVDNTDDKFKITLGSGAVDTNEFVMDTSGNITMSEDLTVSGNLLCTSSNIEEMFRVPAHAIPTATAHSLGDMYIDTGDSNKLKICTTAGTPGTFTVVGSQS